MGLVFQHLPSSKMDGKNKNLKRKTLNIDTKIGILVMFLFCPEYHHHHYHVQEGLGLIPVSCILKMKLVPPSLPRSSYVSSSFWFTLQCLFKYPVCVHPLFVL